MAFLGGAREVERARHGEEIADLMHFHQNCIPQKSPGRKEIAMRGMPRSSCRFRQSPAWCMGLEMVIGRRIRVRALG